MELEISVGTKFMNKLSSDLEETETEVIQDALSVLKWIVDEAKQGRVIVSSDEDGQKLKRLSINSVNSILRERGVNLTN